MTASAPPVPASAPRVAIIGTGVIGAMAAWQLAARGAEVLAFDRYGRGHDRGASAGESRIFRTAYKEGGSYVPLLRRAGELWRELEAVSGRQLLTMCGGLTIGAPDEPDVLAVRRCAEETGLPHDILDSASAAWRFPQHRLDPGEIALLDPNMRRPAPRAVRPGRARRGGRGRGEDPLLHPGRGLRRDPRRLAAAGRPARRTRSTTSSSPPGPGPRRWARRPRSRWSPG